MVVSVHREAEFVGGELAETEDESEPVGEVGRCLGIGEHRFDRAGLREDLEVAADGLDEVGGAGASGRGEEGKQCDGGADTAGGVVFPSRSPRVVGRVVRFPAAAGEVLETRRIRRVDRGTYGLWDSLAHVSLRGIVRLKTRRPGRLSGSRQT